MYHSWIHPFHHYLLSPHAIFCILIQLKIKNKGNYNEYSCYTFLPNILILHIPLYILSYVKNIDNKQATSCYKIIVNSMKELMGEN
jgi:hypothetical protein